MSWVCVCAILRLLALVLCIVAHTSKTKKQGLLARAGFFVCFPEVGGGSTILELKVRCPVSLLHKPLWIKLKLGFRPVVDSSYYELLDRAVFDCGLPVGCTTNSALVLLIPWHQSSARFSPLLVRVLPNRRVPAMEVRECVTELRWTQLQSSLPCVSVAFLCSQPNAAVAGFQTNKQKRNYGALKSLPIVLQLHSFWNNRKHPCGMLEFLFLYAPSAITYFRALNLSIAYWQCLLRFFLCAVHVRCLYYAIKGWMSSAGIALWSSASCPESSWRPTNKRNRWPGCIL